MVFLFLIFASRITDICYAHVFCQDMHSTPWTPLGYACPVNCASVIAAVKKINELDFDNVFTMQYETEFLNISDSEEDGYKRNDMPGDISRSQPVHKTPRINSGPEQSQKDSGSEQSQKDSGPEQSQKDSGPEQSQTDSGTEQSQKDSGLEQSQKDSGPEQSQKDSGPEQSQKDSGPEQSQKDSGPEQSQKASGPEQSQTDSGTEQSQKDSGPEQSQKDSGVESRKRLSRSNEFYKMLHNPRALGEVEALFKASSTRFNNKSCQVIKSIMRNKKQDGVVGKMLQNCGRRTEVEEEFVGKFTAILNKFTSSDKPFTEKLTSMILQKILGPSMDLRHGVFDAIRILRLLRRALVKHQEFVKRRGTVIKLTSKFCMNLYVPGCFCMRGFVEHRGMCVKPADCFSDPKSFSDYTFRVTVH